MAIESGSLSGSAPVLKKYQIGEAFATAGVPAVASAIADADGVMKATTTDCRMVVGLTKDAQATRNTAQQTANADPAVFVTLDVRPDLISLWRLSGGATSGTALTELTNTTLDTTGLLLTFSASQATYDDGYMWGATGANAGILRKIIALTTTGTPIIAYPNDIAAGDTFYACTFGPAERSGVQFTTALDEVNAAGDNQAENNLRCVDFLHRAKAQSGATQSFARLVWAEHLFRFSGSAAA